MKISLDNNYHSELYFLPARNYQNKLIGLTVFTNFVSDDGQVRIPTELVIPRMSGEQQYRLFKEQLDVIERCQHFFMQHNLLAWVYLSAPIAESLLNDDETLMRILRLSFIELLINENDVEIARGVINPSLIALSHQFALVLANFGAGELSTKAIFEDLFKRVIFDKSFVHKQSSRLSFEPFIRAIIAQISVHTESLMVCGIDSDKLFQQVMPFHFFAMQAGLWPAVATKHVTTLVQ
ncbi:EAL domain-containing protein [Escherichia fergusonii]|nr:EAL domain-containing protein [Escherichia fergusonii]